MKVSDWEKLLYAHSISGTTSYWAILKSSPTAKAHILDYSGLEPGNKKGNKFLCRKRFPKYAFLEDPDFSFFKAFNYPNSAEKKKIPKQVTYCSIRQYKKMISRVEDFCLGCARKAQLLNSFSFVANLGDGNVGTFLYTTDFDPKRADNQQVVPHPNDPDKKVLLTDIRIQHDYKVSDKPCDFIVPLQGAKSRLQVHTLRSNKGTSYDLPYTLLSSHPLNITPSIYCPHCGAHAFVTGGHWRMLNVAQINEKVAEYKALKTRQKLKTKSEGK